MTGRRRALAVGVDDYPFAPLSGCVRDATEMARVLARHEDQSPNFDVKLLTAPAGGTASPRITKAQLRDQVTRLFRPPADVALLYLSGHGTANALGGSFVTQDAEQHDDGLPLTEVLTLAHDSPAEEVVVVIDCCHSGALGQVPILDPDKAILRQGLSILTASRPSEAAVERRGMGLFTSLFVAALEGGAADTIGNVSVAGAYAYVDESLGPWDQRPLFKSHVATMIPLRRAAPAVDLAVLRRLPAWFATADAHLPLDPSYEPDAEPAHPEHEEVFAHLQRCRAAKLVEPVGEDHMYYAAMRSRPCRLTPLGRHYWRLADEGRI